MRTTSEQYVCVYVLECSLLVSDRGFIGDKVNGTLKDINECNNGVNYRQTLPKMTGREKQFSFSFARCVRDLR